MKAPRRIPLSCGGVVTESQSGCFGRRLESLVHQSPYAHVTRYRCGPEWTATAMAFPHAAPVVDVGRRRPWWGASAVPPSTCLRSAWVWGGRGGGRLHRLEGGRVDAHADLGAERKGGIAPVSQVESRILGRRAWGSCRTGVGAIAVVQEFLCVRAY